MLGLLGESAAIVVLMLGFAFAFDLMGEGSLDLTNGLIALAAGSAVGGILLLLAGNRVEKNTRATAEALGV